MPADTMSNGSRMFPTIKITKITDPSRFYAVPLIGILVKIIMLIPVYIFLAACSLALFFILFVNSFVVLFTGKYMRVAYDLTLGVMRLTTKVDYFYSGLTNKYPGFSFDIQDNFSVNIPFPNKPNRFFAIPILGGLGRFLLLIPFYIYSIIVRNAVNVALFISWVPVLFNKNYPDTTFEIERDSVRLTLSLWAYASGISDKYPSFWISMNHKQRKILLLIAGLLLFVMNSGRNTQRQQNTYQPHPQPTKGVTAPR